MNLQISIQKHNKMSFPTNFSKIIFFRYADEVLIGNEVLVEKTNALVSAKVLNISTFKMQGIYYLLTPLWQFAILKFQKWNTEIVN